MAIEYTKVGRILEDGTIEREPYEQGCVFKDEEAFEKKVGTCYVPELTDDEYTYYDFIKIAKGSKEVAKRLFLMVDWQTPETLLEELMDIDEVTECELCNKLYESYNVDNCPHCNYPKNGVKANSEVVEATVLKGMNVDGKFYAFATLEELVEKLKNDGYECSLVFKRKRTFKRNVINL